MSAQFCLPDACFMTILVLYLNMVNVADLLLRESMVLSNLADLLLRESMVLSNLTDLLLRESMVLSNLAD